MILTILSLLPIAVGLLLMALPHILPEELSSRLSEISRNICMGVALALLAISTWAAATDLWSVLRLASPASAVPADTRSIPAYCAGRSYAARAGPTRCFTRRAFGRRRSPT